MVCTWFGELSYCSCRPVVPCSAWVLLSYVWQTIFTLSCIVEFPLNLSTQGAKFRIHATSCSKNSSCSRLISVATPSERRLLNNPSSRRQTGSRLEITPFRVRQFQSQSSSPLPTIWESFQGRKLQFLAMPVLLSHYGTWYMWLDTNFVRHAHFVL